MQHPIKIKDKITGAEKIEKIPTRKRKKLSQADKDHEDHV